MPHIAVSLLAVLLALLPGPAAAGEPLAPEELAALLERGRAGGPQLLDVRTPDEYAQGHIPGAILIPHDALGRRVDELDPARPVVLYCRTGRRADLAERVLRGRGFEVSQLQGSWLAWEAAGLPVRTGSAQEPAR